MTRIRGNSLPGVPPSGPSGQDGGASSSTLSGRQLQSATGLEGRGRSSDIQAPPRRNASLPPPGSSYQPPVREAVAGPSPQTFYHLTTHANAEAIHQSGGLKPLAHQPEKGVGLDESRQNVSHGAEKAVQELLTGEWKQQVTSPDEHQMVKDMMKKEATETLRHGANAETLYMSTDGSRDYMTRNAFPEQGGVLMRAQLDPKRNALVRDRQGGSEDFRAVGLNVPSSQLEYATVSGAQAKDLGVNEGSLNQLSWKPMPPPDKNFEH